MKKNINMALGAIYSFIVVLIIATLLFINKELITTNINTLVLLPLLTIAFIFALVNIQEFIEQFKKFKIIDYIILVVMLALLIYVSVLWKSDLLSYIATITGVICVIQASRGNIWTFYWGALNVVLYGLSSYNNGVSGDFVLNIFMYFPLQFIGLYTWLSHYSNNTDTVKKETFTIITWIVTIITLVLGTVFLANILPYVNKIFSMPANTVVYFDAFTTFGAAVAQVLMTRRYKEQWLLWIVVNVASIFIWIYRGDYILTVMWIAYLINSVYGAYKWYKVDKEK